MIRRSTFAVLLAVGLMFSVQTAQAQSPAWLITGGELGEEGVHLYLEILGQPDGLGLPGPNGRRIEPPEALPSFVYELYDSQSNFAVPYQMAAGGPQLSYYPELGAVYFRSRSNPELAGWYELTASAAASLDFIVAAAVAKRDEGGAEPGPAEADFRARKLALVAYGILPYPAAGLAYDEFAQLSRQTDRATSEPLDAQVRGALSEEFVMRHLIETVTAPFAGVSAPDDAPPTFFIWYSGQTGPGTGIGGMLGMYSPPVAGAPGRFWPDGYLLLHYTSLPAAERLHVWPDDPESPLAVIYWRTTPGFDAFVAAALSGDLPATSARASVDSSMATVALTAALLAAVLGLAGTAVALRGTRAG